MDIKEIDFVEFKTANNEIYKIGGNNILECNCNIALTKLENCDDSVPLVQNLLLVIDNYDEISSEDGENFNNDSEYISEITIMYKNNLYKFGYVNLTTDFYNENQKSYIDNNRLYLTIDEEI